MIDAYIAGVALLLVFLGVSTHCDGSLSFFHEHSTSLRTLQAPLLSFFKTKFCIRKHLVFKKLGSSSYLSKVWV